MDLLRQLHGSNASFSLPSVPIEPLPDIAPHTTGQRCSQYFLVPRGQLTFDAEGIEAPHSTYHSRRAHVPSNRSGITIGRGFDLSRHDPTTIRSIFNQSGIDSEFITLGVRASGLRGESARKFLKTNRFPELQPSQQWELFNLTWQMMERDVQRIIEKPDVIERYGTVQWDRVPRPVQDLVVDLRFRGDYTPSVRERLQAALAQGDYKKVQQIFQDRSYWIGERGVPPSRYESRARAAARPLY